MTICGITEDDDVEFNRLFPYAMSWLIRRSLEREHEMLLRYQELNILSDWQKTRLTELNAWKIAVS